MPSFIYKKNLIPGISLNFGGYNFFYRARNLGMTGSLYQKRREVIFNLLVSNNVPPVLKQIITATCKIKNFRTRHSSEMASPFPHCA
jgi:hypothetical protein